jgi:hypothetical protein
MAGASQRHVVVLNELVEWWEDLSQQEIHSQAVLLPVPPRWGRTYLLDQFAAIVKKDEALGIVIRVPGRTLPDGLGLQALELQRLFAEAHVEHGVEELLGVDRLGGVIQLGLGVAGLFVSPLAALVGLLVGSVGVGAAGRAWDTTPAGQEGVVARLARAVAAVSASLPVVVAIDDVDRLDSRLAVTLVESLIERADGQVLVVATADAGSELISTLLSRAQYGLTAGRVHVAEANSDMGYEARADLAAELCPRLPTVATRRIGRRLGTFADVFVVASSSRLGELELDGGGDTIVAVVDEAINARLGQADPSPESVVLAWAGGILHVGQAERALAVMGAQRSSVDEYVVRLESLIRLTDLASPRLAEQVKVMPTSTRHLLAAAILDEAVCLGSDPKTGLVERVVAWQAAHRVRADLQNREQLAGVQCRLVHGLEELGDPVAAYQVAKPALTEYLAGQAGGPGPPESDALSAAVLRLSRVGRAQRNDPLIETTITAALAGGASVALEARVWAAIDLLGQPSEREPALKLVDEVTAELGTRNDLGPVGDSWRLLLAFHVGRAGYPAITQRLLAPMLTTSPEQGDAASAVLFAVGGPEADTRLQIIGLQAELQALPADAADDRLRLHHALSTDHARTGDYNSALNHARHELLLRRQIQGADHPDTLRTRGSIAEWTGESGDPAEALRLYRELLPDQQRVLGPSHPGTLTTRFNITAWTSHSGNPAEALRLAKELLPDQERILGRSHPSTLSTRNGIAEWTGRSGHPAEALRLYRELLPDRERVLGPDHPDTLINRNNIANWTGYAGHPVEAVRLCRELLPDQEQVLGPDHPDTLTTRNNIASWTGEAGHPMEALLLYRELLPDQEQVLGPDHPDTLLTRSRVALWVGNTGHPAEALRLAEEVLPDQERVLGLDHPDTLDTRNTIAAFTGYSGDPSGALRLFRKLLPDEERVLGPDHPDTLTTRNNIAVWTAERGHPAEALRLFQELLPDQERLLGPNHPDTLLTRSNIAALTTRL